MDQLHRTRCVPCQRGAPQASAEEIVTYMAEVPDWEIIEVDGVKRLTRSFAFDNFIHALAFTNRLGELAELEGHHPALLTEWGKVTATWWTHAIKGLHKNDFIMASKSDEAYRTAKGVREGKRG